MQKNLTKIQQPLAGRDVFLSAKNLLSTNLTRDRPTRPEDRGCTLCRPRGTGDSSRRAEAGKEELSVCKQRAVSVESLEGV